MTPIPKSSDRSAKDALNYPSLHTNDADIGVSSLHHTLGTGSNQAAAGNHTHPASSPVSTPYDVLFYEDSIFKATGTRISFNDGLSVLTTGSSVFVSADVSTYCGTYQRVGQPTQQSDATWIVPDQIYASGSLSVFVNGLAKIPNVDYEEMFWVSGTYRFLLAQTTGTYHLVIYGVPCATQTQPPSGTSTYFLVDTDNILLLDSNDVQLIDSDG